MTNDVIQKSSTKLHYEVPTMFGKFDVDIEKKEEKLIVNISGSILTKEFSFETDKIRTEIQDFILWLG